MALKDDAHVFIEPGGERNFVQDALAVKSCNPQDDGAQPKRNIQEVEKEPLEDSSWSHASDGHLRGCSTRAKAVVAEPKPAKLGQLPSAAATQVGKIKVIAKK